VAQGRLRYCIDTAPPQSFVIEQGGAAVIEPEALHHVELLDAETRFLVEFHRWAGAA
jgi:tellurite resistance-related uncharacterized protein